MDVSVLIEFQSTAIRQGEGAFLSLSHILTHLIGITAIMRGTGSMDALISICHL